MGIEIVSQCKINPRDYGYNGNCIVTYVHVKIADIKKRAQIIKNDFLDMSWINKLDIATKMAYEQRANDTLSKLIKDVLDKVEDKITEEFGEILVSTSAKDTLCTHYNHKKIPLAELWKEKNLGNPGFDFHSQNKVTDTVIFGEAKYVSKTTAYSSALPQIVEFIGDGKDVEDLPELKPFCTPSALQRAAKGIKGFSAAFSAKSTGTDKIIKNIVKRKDFQDLLQYEEIILVAVDL